MISEKFDNEITICTVCTNDEILIQKNIEIISKLNKQIKINWVIGINKKNISEVNFKTYDTNIKYTKGVPSELIGSIALNHSITLNLTKKYIDTRFVLFIDPDFFLLKENILEEIIKDMIAEKISFLGTPWYPKWHTKFRYFPCSHCLFVDTENISLDLFDFRPIKIFWDKEYYKYNLFIDRKSLFKRIFFKMLSLNNFINYNFVHRKNNAFDGDTCHRIYLNLRDSKYKFKIFNPGFNIKNDWLIPISWKLNNLIEFFLPEKYCFFPKRKKLIVFDTKFINYLSSFSYEGFYWKNQPIGFHIRGHPKRMIKERNKEEELENVNNIFKKFFDLN